MYYKRIQILPNISGTSFKVTEVNLAQDRVAIEPFKSSGNSITFSEEKGVNIKFTLCFLFFFDKTNNKFSILKGNL